MDQKWQDDSTTPVIKDRFEYTYDRNSNRLTRSNDLNTDLSEAYSYDGLDRLVGADRDGANLQDWGLDSLGNWASFTEGSTTQDRTHNAGNEIQTAEGWAGPTYDDAGNMTSGPVPGTETVRQHYRYDAWNRLVAVYADDDGDPGDLVASYAYDGSGRRIAKIVPDGEDWSRTDYYLNEDGQALEERSGTFESLQGTGGARTTVAETPAVQYLWDIRYSDAPVLRWRDADADPETGQGGLEETLYYCQDANFNTTALVDASTGEVAEHYYYDPYGKAHICDDSWTEISWSNSLQNTVLYGGYGLDAESGLYHTDYREYDCSLGRFIQVDPAGLAAGPNVYAYCGGWPTGATDPTGLEPDFGKVSQGIFSVCEGATEILFGLPAGGTGPANLALIGKGFGDYALGYNKIVEGFRGTPGDGAPANVAEAIADQVSKVTGAPLDETRQQAGLLDFALTGMAAGYPRFGPRNLGPNTYKVDTSYNTWNQFQRGTSGQFASRAQAAKAWGTYKNANGIVGGTARNEAARRQFLESLGEDYRTPSWMKPWLEEGRVPPGYEVDHIKPLSIGGSNTAENMRLQLKSLHDVHHSPGFYRPWE